MSHMNEHQCSCCGGCQQQEVLPEALLSFIEECKKDPQPSGQLIAVLHKAQEIFGYLSQDVMDAIVYAMEIPAAKVSGVATFYHYFRLKPRGKFVISVCMGTACYVKGAEAVTNKFREELGIEVGETTSDGMFTLEIARCLGTCALAPVAKIGDDIHSEVTADKVPAISEHYIKSAK